MGRWAKGILGPSKKQPAGAKLATQLDTQYKRNSAHEAEVLQQVSHSVSSPTTDFPSPPLPSTSRRCATKTSDSSLDSQAGFSPKDSFFPLPQSARFAKARFPFKPQKIDIDAQPLEWVPVPPKGRPPARGVCAHSTTRVGNALYVIGGCDSHGCLNTIRKLDLSTLQWTKLRPEYRSADHDESSSAKPPKLRAHTATRVHDCIVVYGGGNGPQCKLPITVAARRV